MALTTYAPAITQQAGFIKLLLGPKITSLAAPSLAAFTIDATCAFSQFDLTTDVSMTERQDFCHKDAYEQLDRRVRKLGQLVFRGHGTDQTAILALLAEDAEIGFFVRPYVDSDTAVVVADKGWAVNARVAKIDPNPLAIGNDYEWIAEFYAVTRNLNAVMAA